MKLSEIIAQIDLTGVTTPASFQDLSEVFGVHEWLTDDDSRDEWELRTREHYIEPWYCTDTWVGVSVIFLDGVPVAVASQPARKSDTIYKWISTETYQKTRDFLMSLIKPKEEHIDLMDLDEEWGDGYHVEFDSQVLFKKGTYNGEPVTVKHWSWYDINTLKDPSYQKVGMCESVVDFENGDRKVVDTFDILFPYLTKDYSNYRD